MQLTYNYPAPDRRDIVFTRFLSLFLCFFVSLFVSLSARLRENGWTDLHEIFREGVEWPWDDLITFWVNSGKPRDARGRGLLCRAPQVVCIYFAASTRADARSSDQALMCAARIRWKRGMRKRDRKLTTGSTDVGHYPWIWKWMCRFSERSLVSASFYDLP